MARQRLKGRGACSTPCQAHHQRPYSSNIFLLLQGYVVCCSCVNAVAYMLDALVAVGCALC